MQKHALTIRANKLTMVGNFSNKAQSMTESTPKTLTLTALADYLTIKKRTLYNMIDDGRFPVEPIKGTQPRLWNVADVDAWRATK